MVKVSAPGKLVLAGEWSVLEQGNCAIVGAVDKRVFIEVEESQNISISMPDFGIENLDVVFDGKKLIFPKLTQEQEADLIFIKSAIETTLQYLGAHKKFKIKSYGKDTQIEVAGQKKKVGFGSSAATVVATVTALLVLNGYDIKNRQVKDSIYKLGAIAHYFAQGKVGSGFDVAASVYGGVFVYKRFDCLWLEEKIKSGVSIKNIVEEEWPSFFVEQLTIPHDIEIIVAWTKESASTPAMIKEMDVFKKKTPEEYIKCYSNMSSLVVEIVNSWKKMDKQKILMFFRKNEDLLRELGELSGVKIETPELKKLSELANSAGAAGKLSGAGGGDCGIAVCFDKETSEKVKAAWQKEGLYIIDTQLDREGVRLENV